MRRRIVTTRSGCLKLVAFAFLTVGAPPTSRLEAQLVEAPKRFTVAEMVGDLTDQGKLFRSLDVDSTYAGESRYRAAPRRNAIDTDLPAGSLQAFTWLAPQMQHQPLYFEQVNLERYGTGPHPCLQPAASAVHFLSAAAVLPYKAGRQCPSTRVYALGDYRPGDCTPHHLYYEPWSWRGFITQSLAVTSLGVTAP